MFNLGQVKIDKYYKLIDITPIYLIALVFYLLQKQKYIKKYQNTKQILSYKEKIKEFQEKQYNLQSTTPPPPTSSSANTQPPNDFFKWLKDDDDNNTIDNEYAWYYSLPQILGIKQGYTQWIKPTQQKRFLNLSKIALNVLSIPAMSADPERLFLGAKITITDRRNRLGIRTI